MDIYLLSPSTVDGGRRSRDESSWVWLYFNQKTTLLELAKEQSLYDYRAISVMEKILENWKGRLPDVKGTRNRN